jgi:hypothetical protein
MPALSRRSIQLGLALFAAIAATTPAELRAQTVSAVRSVSISATKSSALTVTLTSGLVQFISLKNNQISNGSSPIGITTRWDLNPGLASGVRLAAFFSTAANALSDGGANKIASSKVEGRVLTGVPTTFTAMSQMLSTNPGIPSGLLLFSETLSGANRTKTRNDVLDIRVNLTGVSINSAVYTGTLFIQAFTY